MSNNGYIPLTKNDKAFKRSTSTTISRKGHSLFSSSKKSFDQLNKLDILKEENLHNLFFKSFALITRNQIEQTKYLKNIGVFANEFIDFNDITKLSEVKTFNAVDFSKEEDLINFKSFKDTSIATKNEMLSEGKSSKATFSSSQLTTHISFLLDKIKDLPEKEKTFQIYLKEYIQTKVKKNNSMELSESKLSKKIDIFIKSNILELFNELRAGNFTKVIKNLTQKIKKWSLLSRLKSIEKENISEDPDLLKHQKINTELSTLIKNKELLKNAFLREITLLDKLAARNTSWVEACDDYKKENLNDQNAALVSFFLNELGEVKSKSLCTKQSRLWANFKMKIISLREIEKADNNKKQKKLCKKLVKLFERRNKKKKEASLSNKIFPYIKQDNNSDINLKEQENKIYLLAHEYLAVKENIENSIKLISTIPYEIEGADNLENSDIGKTRGNLNNINNSNRQVENPKIGFFSRIFSCFKRSKKKIPKLVSEEDIKKYKVVEKALKPKVKYLMSFIDDFFKNHDKYMRSIKENNSGPIIDNKHSKRIKRQIVKFNNYAITKNINGVDAEDKIKHIQSELNEFMILKFISIHEYRNFNYKNKLMKIDDFLNNEDRMNFIASIMDTNRTMQQKERNKIIRCPISGVEITKFPYRIFILEAKILPHVTVIIFNKDICQR